MINNAVAIICSTPYSKRINRKCFINIAGKPALQHIIDRIAPLEINTIIAVPDGTAGEYNAILTKNKSITIMEGDKDSPLRRIVQCLTKIKNINGYEPKYIVRITHDDILIDAKTMEELIHKTEETGSGYGYSPKIVEGAGVEVIAAENIYFAAGQHTEPIEHISYFVKGEGCPNPKICEYEPRKEITKDYRLTLDYNEDRVVLEAVLRKLGNDASLDKICNYLEENLLILQYNKIPAYSVYTCVYNGAKWISDMIRSMGVFDNETEHIIVDDCSTDNTLEELLHVNRFFGEDRKRKIIVNGKNVGLSSSSNIALSEARGKYIMRLDCDDMIYGLNILLSMRKKMEEEKSVICYSAYKEINESGNIITEYRDPAEYHHIGCALADKRWLNELRFKEGIRNWDGLELHARIKGRFRISYFKDMVLWRYRIRPDSMSRTNLEERRRTKPNVILN